jgi:asparagine synthase (glutamine-hydrolysing)
MELNDKTAAMHGLEMAFPFLDRDLLAFLMAIPGEVQSWKGIYKGLLREGLRGVLPAAIARRTTKADFTTLMHEGLLEDHDRLTRRLRAGGMVTALGYIEDRALTDAAAGKSGASTCEPGWALTDLLALELWLSGFFGSNDQHVETEVF